MNTPNTKVAIDTYALQLAQALALEVCEAKVRVTAGMRVKAENLKAKLSGMLAPVPESSLRNDEVCLMCGSIGAEKKKREAKKKPVCHRCHNPFTRETPWQLHRGHRVHSACLVKPISEHHE